MNTGNFKNSGASAEPISVYPLPDKLGGGARAALVIAASVFMLLSGLWNVIGFASGDAVLFAGVLVLSWLVYIILGGICALLWLDCSKVAFLPPAVAFLGSLGVSFLIGGRMSYSAFFISLFSIFPALCGFIIAVSMKKGAKRTGAILSAAIGLGLFSTGLLILSAAFSGQNIGLSHITATIDSARAAFIEAMQTTSAKLSEIYGNDISGMDIELAVNSVFNLLPAIICTMFMTVAFFSQLSLLALCRICGLYHKLEKKDTEFSLSVITALVFAVSYLMSIILSSGDSAALAVFDNLGMMLQPALAVVGLMSVLPKREGNMLRVGCFPLVAVLLLLTFAPAIAFVLLSVMGTFETFKAARRTNGQDK
ncbi:MAG: hypothetical protein IJ303_05420, partial [Clostridia bacterium]|nr:hypothetical protein [Clostridia bacterium]